jgi:hypothetical protein
LAGIPATGLGEIRTATTTDFGDCPNELASLPLGQIGSPLAVPPLLTAMNPLIDVLTSIGLNHLTSIELIQSTAKNLIDHATDRQGQMDHDDVAANLSSESYPQKK